MTDLNLDLLGCKLRNPVIIASSPLTEDLKGIIECFNNGASAVITKSISKINKGNPSEARRAYFDKEGLWATSTYFRETLDLDSGCDIIASASSKIDIPIIASITGLDFEVEKWIGSCEKVILAGAKMIQLDLFYLPQPITNSTNLNKLKRLIKDLSQLIQVPIIPKINIEIPAYLIKELFSESNIKCISFLDSIRVPSPITKNLQSRYKMVRHLGMSSLFGSWQLPLTNHYAIILRKTTDYQLIGGGGISNSCDILTLLMLGVNATQIASTIIINGFGYISTLIKNLEEDLIEEGFTSIHEIQNKITKSQTIDIEQSHTVFIESYAIIDQKRCSKCKKCITLSFCRAIIEMNGVITINSEICEGCGLCVSCCNENAIFVIERD